MDEIDGEVDPLSTYSVVNLELLNEVDEEFGFPAIVDTGYNGEVILPESKNRETNLTFLGTIDGEVATGDVVKVEFFKCRINWFDKVKEITVGATGSDNSILGTLLLTDCELGVNFRDNSVRIQRLD